MAHTTRAWVMDVAAGWRVAAGASQVVEYLLAPATVDVPRTPKHCAGLLVWREQMIPVIDFAPLQAAATPDAEQTDGAGNERSTSAAAPAALDDGSLRSATSASPGAVSPATPAPPSASQARRAVVLAWQDAPAQPLRYGALLVTAAPTEFWVSDDMAGPLAEMPAVFRHVARACFIQQDRVIPILDTRQLFGRPLARVPARAEDIDERGPRLAPEVDELPQSHSVAETVREWTATQTEALLPALPPEPVRDAALPEAIVVAEAAAPAYCVVLPFPSARPADLAPAAAEPVYLEEPREWPEFAPVESGAPADSQNPATFGAAGPTVPMAGADSATSAGAAAAAVVQQERSNTLQSFQRLHAIEQAIEGRDPRPRHPRWWLSAAAVGLAVLTGVLFVFMDFSVRAPAPAKEAAVRDVAPGGINPASVPSTPAQPPK